MYSRRGYCHGEWMLGWNVILSQWQHLGAWSASHANGIREIRNRILGKSRAETVLEHESLAFQTCCMLSHTSGEPMFAEPMLTSSPKSEWSDGNFMTWSTSVMLTGVCVHVSSSKYALSTTTHTQHLLSYIHQVQSCVLSAAAAAEQTPVMNTPYLGW